MRHVGWVCVLLAVGCGPKQHGEAAPPSQAAPAVVVVEPEPSPNPQSEAEPASHLASEPADVEDVALRFYRAMFAGESRTVLELALTFEEMSALTTKPVERAEFDAAMSAFAHPDPDREPAEVVRIEVVERGTLRADESEKVTRDLEYALIRPIVLRGGEERPGLTRPFFKTEHGWKFSPKQ
jgi:hypothetical protein